MPMVTLRPIRRSIFVGIDPGKKGGIAAISRSGNVLLSEVMPESDLDLWNIVKNLCWALDDDPAEPYICIEKVSTSPQMGVVSAGTFMEGYGRLRMALTAAEYRFMEVRPQVWQSSLGIPKRINKGPKKETDHAWKDRLRKKAQQLFPRGFVQDNEKIPWGMMTLEVERSISDALLIAHYCKQFAFRE